MSDADRRAALLRRAVGRDGPIVPTAADWPEWTWLARIDRATPLLYHLVDQTPTGLDDDQRTDLRQQFGVVMCRCVELEHNLLEVSTLLADSGVPAVTLKGGATAHLDYPDPEWREFSDIDLLVDPSDMPKATAVVEAAGWVQGYALPARHDEYTHAITFVKRGMELDLHQRIAHRALGRLLPTDELIARAVSFRVADVDLLALDEVDRFMHAAVHAVASGRDEQRLSGLADLLIVAARRPHLAGPVLERAEQRRVRSLVERAIRDAYTIAQLDLESTWAAAVAQPGRRRDRLVDRAYLDTRRRPALEELAHLRLLDGWRDRVRYVTGYFSEEQEGPIKRSRYLWSKLRRRR